MSHKRRRPSTGRHRRSFNMLVGRKVQYMGSRDLDTLKDVEFINSRAAFQGKQSRVKTVLRIGRDGVLFETKTHLFRKNEREFVPLSDVRKVCTDIHKPFVLLIGIIRGESCKIYGFKCHDENDASYIKHTFRQLIPSSSTDKDDDINGNGGVVVPSKDDELTPRSKDVLQNHTPQRITIPTNEAPVVDSGFSSDENGRRSQQSWQVKDDVSFRSRPDSMFSNAEYQQENAQLKREVSRLTDEVRTLREMFESQVGLSETQSNSQGTGTVKSEAKVSVPDYRHVFGKTRKSKSVRSEISSIASVTTNADSSIRSTNGPGRTLDPISEDMFHQWQRDRAEKIRAKARIAAVRPAPVAMTTLPQKRAPAYAIPLFPNGTAVKPEKRYVARSMTNLTTIPRPSVRPSGSLYRLDRRKAGSVAVLGRPVTKVKEHSL